MEKVRSSLVPTALLLAIFGVGCGQESTDGHSGSGGSSDHDSSRSASASGSAGDTGTSGVASGGQSVSSSATAGQRADTGGSTSSPSSGGGGGASSSNVQSGESGGSSSVRGGAVSSSLREDAGVSGTGGSSAAPDAGKSLPKDAGAPTGDTAVIPPLPVRQDAGLSFWAAAFAGNCKPPAIGTRAQDDGHHKPGTNCMTSGCHLNPKKPEHHAGTDCRGSGCHANGSPDGSGAPAFLFGGTAYRAATLVAEVGAEVGVKAGAASYTACSASNGNFWVVAPSGTTSLTWAGASIRLRNANGEAPMMTTAAAGCNATACHTGTLKMTAP